MTFRLQPGAGVAVVATAGPVEADSYRAGLAVVEARYRVVQTIEQDAVHPGIPYLVNTDERRAAQLNAALADPEVEAIFCARGGYGSMRILDRLDWEPLLRRRVPIVGFSDCTVLHFWAAGLTVPSVHGPTLAQLGDLPPADQESLFDLLEGRPPRLEGLDCLRPGCARGRLVGGNLALICHLIGTRYMPDLDGAILLLEEVNEAPYRIDRQLTQLTMAGVFERVAGVVVGTLTGCDMEQGIPPTPVKAISVFEERLGGLDIPVVTGAPVGHGDRNVSLPLGVEAEVDAGEGTLGFPVETE